MKFQSEPPGKRKFSRGRNFAIKSFFILPLTEANILYFHPL